MHKSVIFYNNMYEKMVPSVSHDKGSLTKVQLIDNRAIGAFISQNAMVNYMVNLYEQVLALKLVCGNKIILNIMRTIA